MSYYCSFTHGQDSVAATQVILHPDTGDTISACPQHMLQVAMGQIGEIVTEDNLVQFLTTWLENVMGNQELPTEPTEGDGGGDSAPKSRTKSRARPEQESVPPNETEIPGPDD